MKNRFFSGVAFLGLTVLFLTSCTEVPQAEIDNANAAIELAKSAGADIYVHDNFIALQDSMSQAMVSIESQKSKLFKNYNEAIEKLGGVCQYAAEIQHLSDVRKIELNAEIQKTIEEVSVLIASNNSLILEAPKGKEGNSALVAIKGENDAIETSINEIKTLAESTNYQITLDKTNAAKDKALSINTELTNVIAKFKGNQKVKKS